jgi:hypothetical protein
MPVNERAAASVSVDVATMSKRDRDDKQNVAVNRVDDPVVTDPNVRTWTALQRTGGRRTRIVCQQSDGTLEATTDGRVKLAYCPYSGRSQLDPVIAHVQPRSTLTSSQGMFGPSSAIAASKAATSSASSNAAAIFSYCSGLTSTAANRP